MPKRYNYCSNMILIHLNSSCSINFLILFFQPPSSLECKSGLTGFKIYYSADASDSTKEVDISNITTTEHTLKGLEIYVEYTMYMSSSNTDASSDDSEPAKAYTLEESTNCSTMLKRIIIYFLIESIQKSTPSLFMTLQFSPHINNNVTSLIYPIAFFFTKAMLTWNIAT